MTTPARLPRGFIKGEFWNGAQAASLEWKWKRDCDIRRICDSHGRSKKAIWEYARKQGWHRGDALEKRHRRRKPPGEKLRRCLSCLEDFKSSGPGNRLCDGCKTGDHPAEDDTFTAVGAASGCVDNSLPSDV